MEKTGTIIKKMLNGALWFGGLGPPIGALLFWVALLGTSISERDGENFAVLFGGIIFFIFWSYIFGLVPAVLSGFVLGPFRQHINPWPRFLASGLICSIISSAWGLAVWSSREIGLMTSNPWQLSFAVRPLLLAQLPLDSGA
ncbi:MAG: hypothetical protein KJ063_14560 [Anaerolineae bacterium]|nr:hypothetical protein [Anaerolineae bacterium]